MRRSAISIPSNIAEGRTRGTKKDYLQFLRVAYGSGAELETQIIICKRLFGTKDFDYTNIDMLLGEVMRMMNAMIRKMNPAKANAANAANEAIS